MVGTLPKLGLAAAAVTAAVYYARWLEQPSAHLAVDMRGVVHAPDWLEQAVKDLPRRRINASEREAFRGDGAILIKDLVPDPRILKEMEESIGWKKGKWENSWWWHGVLHTVIKHGPLAELCATALDVPEVTIWNAQAEPRPSMDKRPWPLPEKPWYDEHYGDVRDMSVHEDTDAYVGSLHKSGHFAKPQCSIFLGLTDIPHGLEMLAGSHVANQHHLCHRDWGSKHLDPNCMDRLERDCRGVRWWDMKAGDAVLFYGSTFHWTILQEKPRLAVSIRYIPADMMYTGRVEHDFLASYYNGKCGPIGGCPAFPIFYSTNSSRIKDEPWPLYPKNKDFSPLVGAIRWLRNRLDLRCGEIREL